MTARVASRLLTGSFAALLAAQCAGAWGAAAQRLIAAKAVETLPPEIRGFYEANSAQIRSLVVAPTQRIGKDPNEARYHVLYLNRYSPFPYDSLPRAYKAAVAKYGRPKIDANGVLPWQVGVYSERLTTAFRNREWDNVRQYSALLANFVAETHDPFNMIDTHDLRSGVATGLQARFGASLVERYSVFFPMRPNDASFIKDPTETAFEDCLTSHSWVEVIENADRRSRAGLADYDSEFYDRFYNQVGAVLIRQLTDSASEVGSFWLTSWVNAGKPPLPQ